ncbi:hypothetical protein [Streptomyces sp. A012304]|uniref:hypothetical protein n=1 Tax=Streptomyces sp. A012304 TaxID=375446 RepID=UPI00222F7BAD|nr:hypothetical protein [Streptomyces sp. A012304]GKQ37052.1 hypothetical protein ALMP_35910 [Streptomyces sp. A012304]
MNDWLPVLGGALVHGPGVAFAAAFAISPGIPALLALVLERRVLHPRQEFVAFIYGDPLLALAAATGVALCGGRVADPVRGLVTGGWAWATLAGWLSFGLWQWRSEVRAGQYTFAQAVSPTKIWHQLVIYPVLGYLVTAAALSGLAAGTTAVGYPAKALIVLCIGVWCAANLYDRKHPKPGHPAYDWRKLRPYAVDRRPSTPAEPAHRP